MFSPAISRSTESFTRALGVLLILFILYGTTVEAVHRHGRILNFTNSATSLIEDGQTSNLANSKSSCSDCLICQLHLNFSTTLISVRPNNQSLNQQAVTKTFDPMTIRSISHTPQSGRAPPQAN